MPEPRDKQTERQAGKRLMNLRSRGGLALNIAIAMPLVSGALLLVQAFLLAMVLGRTIQEGAAIETVMPLIIAIGGLMAIRAILGAIGEQAGQIGAEHIKLSLRTDLFAHMLARRSALGLAPASGAVSAAMVDQAEALENFFARYMPAMIAAGILPLAFALVLMPVDWVVGLLFLFTAPLIPVFMALAGWGAQAATDRQAAALARLSAYFADRLRGLLTLKLFGQEDAATQAVHTASEELRLRTNTVLRIAFLSSAILEFFAALGVAGVALYVGLTFLGYLPLHPELTLVAGFFALIMAPEVYQPLRQLAAHYHDRAAARSALDEIERHIAQLDQLEQAAPLVNTTQNNQAAALSAHSLTVRTETGALILDNLDLELAPGTSLAIMGASGIGKTTLMRALARLISAEGEIMLDGQALETIPEAVLRQRLAVITQKPRIFHGTIGQNIAFADPTASKHRVRAAAERALVNAFARDMPLGLETLVGEGGEGLSGGQGQRVALARLFLTNPDLIILDEPTAHLDAETEALLLDEIFRFATSSSLILLTHSRAVAARADRVMTLAGGKLLPTPHKRRPVHTVSEARS